MVSIPDSLLSLFSATVERRDGMYVVEIPEAEIKQGTLEPGGSYRVAVLQQATGVREQGSQVAGAPTSRQSAVESASGPPVEEGDIRDVTIETLGDQGDGIAKVERGYVLIVPNAEPGDDVTVEVEQVRENVAFTQVLTGDSQ